MTFQIRTIPGEQSPLGKEIARKLEDTAVDLLGGVPPEQYLAHIARYKVLLELMDFMDERKAALEKGETVEDE